MISINLRPGQRRKTAGSRLQPAKDALDKMKSSVANPLLAGAIAVIAAVAVGLLYFYTTTGTALAQVEPKLETARAEHKRFQTFLQQKRKQEQIRDSLRAQIRTIRNVDGDRYVWSHVMDEVARALPAYTWLTDIQGTSFVPDTSAGADTLRPPIVFTLTGRTVDIQAYTKFLRDLEASPWIESVTPVQAQSTIEAERAVTAFTIKATYRLADSAYLRTVPLSQSVR